MPVTLSNLIRDNLETVIGLEQQLYRQFTPLERLMHRITLAFGTIWMIALHFLVVGVWVTLNSPLFMKHPIDPWPFHGLILALSLEGIALALLILISQRIMQKLENHRTHLALQIQLLSEQESTKGLEVLARIEQRLGTRGHDDKMSALSEPTRPDELSSALQERMEHNEPPSGRPERDH